MDLIGSLLEPLSYGFVVRALLAAVIVGVVCSVLGTYIVLRGMAFFGDAAGPYHFARRRCGLPSGLAAGCGRPHHGHFNRSGDRRFDSQQRLVEGGYCYWCYLRRFFSPWGWPCCR